MIEFKNVSKYYDSNKVIDQISFTALKGETLVLLGESGCGKTTALKMINKLVEPSEGDISFENESIKDINAIQLRRKIGYVIQDKGLFPHYTVKENIGLLPALLKWKKNKIDETVDQLLDLVELDAQKYRDRYPHELSGGQQQRVAIARALATDPPLVLMDEPFGALDNITRQQVRSQFKKIEHLLSKTIILVTHDISEAFELGDKICLMHEGKIIQTGTPSELLLHPKNKYVEQFFKQDRFLNELQLITINDIINYIEPSGKAGKTGKKISSTSNIQMVLDSMMSDNNYDHILITSDKEDIIKTCNINSILAALVSYKASYLN